MSAAADDKRVIDILNKSFERGRNPSVKLLGGRIVSYDRAKSTLAMGEPRFESRPVCQKNRRCPTSIVGSSFCDLHSHAIHV